MKSMMTAIANIKAGTMICLSLMLAGSASMVRADADPAVAQVASFQSSLLDVMKQGPALGAKGRARKLTPAVERTFNMAEMTRFAVGPSWLKLSDAERTPLIGAFTRLTAASFAHNFDDFSGERFDVDPKVDTRGVDKLVQSHITPDHGAPVSMVFRMRQSGGTWKAIDIFYNGSISQLTTRRSDFAATVASGGAPALVARMNTQTEKLLQ